MTGEGTFIARSPLDRTVQGLGEGTFVTLPTGEPLFRLDSYPGNPIVRPEELGLTWSEDGERRVGAVFNGGAELLDGCVVLTPRCQQRYRRGSVIDAALGEERPSFENYVSEVWPLISDDGVRFRRLGNVVIDGDGSSHDDFTHGVEDIRIVRNGSGYVLVGTGKTKPAHNGLHNADRIAVYHTEDFRRIEYRGMVEAFDTRNAVPLPGPVDGRYYMLVRFRPDIHLDVLECGLDQLLNPARYAEAWASVRDRRRETLLLEAGVYPHEREKIGPGPQLIPTDRGWLLIYHAVGEIAAEICNAYGIEGPIGRGYSVSAALLASDDPRRVLRRTRLPIYIPSAPYELNGDDEYPVDVPAVVFPVGAFVHDGKLLVYAGAGDKYVELLSCGLTKLVDYLWEHGRLDGGM